MSDSNKMIFPEVIDGKINTEEFLKAAQDVVHVVDKFGKLFAPVKYDIQGNIDKLNTKYKSNKECQSTLQDMILLEKSIGETNVATDALLWLRRGLHMILIFFEQILEDHQDGQATEDLVAFLNIAYRRTLEPYHNWMTQQLFRLLSRMAPSRTQLLWALAVGTGDDQETTLNKMSEYLPKLRQNVEILQDFYSQHDL